MTRLIVAVAILAAACVPPSPNPTIPPATIDTSTELNAWMADHTVVNLDGRTIDTNDGPVRPPEGTTLHNGTLRRTVASNAVTFEHVRIDTDIVTLEDLHIEGTRTHNPGYGKQPVYDPTREEQHGVAIRGDWATVRRVSVLNVWGDGIYLDGGARHANIVNPDLRYVGRSSISNVWSYDAHVTGGYAYGAGLWGLNIEPFGAKEVRGYQVTGLTTDDPWSRSWWLWASGPHFNCAVSAVIERPEALNVARRAIIDPCTEDLTVK
jgi:hypothetical protein